VTAGAGPHRGFLWRLTTGLTRRSRQRRFDAFMREMRPSENDRVLDVGVTDVPTRSSNFLEASYPWPANIVAVAPSRPEHFLRAFPDVTFKLGDGRELPFADGEFDIGFSNAVLEHVGSREDQRRFVGEMTRTCRRAFICTPNARFPVDPHTLLPFVHWLPRPMRHRLLRATGNARWASEDALNPLTASEFLALFPPGTQVRLVRQRMLGMTSVLVAITGQPRA
jgi:hypothetical protein